MTPEGRKMGRFVLGWSLIAVPGAALAHPGHLAEVAGHGHWVAGAAVGAAIIIGLWAGLKGRGAKAGAADTEATAETEAEAEPDAA